MRVPLTWLREFVDVKIDVVELAHRLTMAGNEVDSIERTAHIDNVVVGEVLSVSPHPNADRLMLVRVNDGESVHEVVCGAPNVAQGQKIAYASIGAMLFDAFSDEPGKTRRLRKSKIRGVESFGMVCSERELGIGEDHDGILVLPPESELGTPIGDVFGETVLDIELTPNRADCLGVLGVARDVAALTGEILRAPELEYGADGPDVNTLATVTIEDADLCPRYLGAVIQDVEIGPSPQWLQERLLAMGERPINNVVDATNLVMFELGQPLHAFDYDTVTDRHVIVRRSKPGEKITTLDGVSRKLGSDVLLITDPEKAIGLAGIMGGENSEITNATTSVFLESANFNPQNNRKTAGALGMRSEATLRFEKGLRAGLADVAIRRCLRIIQEVAGGAIAEGLIDVWPGKGNEQAFVDLNRERIKQVMGVLYPDEQVESTLASLGFQVSPQPEGWRVAVPYWRSDIAIPEDLIEELARIIGYDDLPMTRPSGEVPQWEPNNPHNLRRQIVDALIDVGMHQSMNYVAVSEEIEEKANVFSMADGMYLDNPVAAQHSKLRISLRPPMLETAARNTRTWRGPVAVFEIGKVFEPKTHLDEHDPLPQELERVTGVMTGPRDLSLWGVGAGDENLDFFDAKGAVEHLLDTLGVEANYIPAEDASYAQNAAAHIVTNDGNQTVIGSVGVVNPTVWENFNPVTESAVMFDLDVDKLRDVVSTHRRADNYTPFPRYPDAPRDLALLVDASIRVGDAVRICTQNRLVRSAEVFDVYEGNGIESGKKSIGIRVIYQSDARTLTSEEVNKAEQQIIRRIERELGATLRA